MAGVGQVLLSILGFSASSLGLASFGLGQLPSHQDHYTTVRIQVGHDGEIDPGQGPTSPVTLGNAGGQFPIIQVIGNTNNVLSDNYDTILMDRGKEIPSGDFRDISIKTPSQASGLQVDAGDDALCIAYMIVTDIQGQPYGISGDIFSYCGKPWFWSGVRLGDQWLKCGWLDAKSDNPATPGSVRYSLTAFSNSTEQEHPHDLLPGKPDLCSTSYITFKNSAYDDVVKEKETASVCKACIGGIIGKRNPEREQKHIRAIKNKKRADRESTLVVVQKGGTAQELCDSPGSMGSDYVNVEEGLFCDMKAKKSYSLCNKNDEKQTCFDLDSYTLVGQANGTLVPRKAPYQNIRHWK